MLYYESISVADPTGTRIPKVNGRKLDDFQDSITFYIEGRIYVYDSKDGDWDWIDQESIAWMDQACMDGKYYSDKQGLYVSDREEISHAVKCLLEPYIPPEVGLYEIHATVQLWYNISDIIAYPDPRFENEEVVDCSSALVKFLDSSVVKEFHFGRIDSDEYLRHSEVSCQ